MEHVNKMLVGLKSGAWDNHGNKDKPLHSAWLRTVPFDWLTIKCAWHLGLSRHVWGHLEVISQTITEVAFTIHNSFRLFSLFHVLLWYNKPILTLSFFFESEILFSCLNFDSLCDGYALYLTQTICPVHRERDRGGEGEEPFFAETLHLTLP